jgi:hypothetical protein
VAGHSRNRKQWPRTNHTNIVFSDTDTEIQLIKLKPGIMKNSTLDNVKYACSIALFVACFTVLSQCKKNNPAPPTVPDEDTTQRLAPGRYIIRTKYICPDGGGFILGSQSNFELQTWQPTNPENVRWQKTADEYIWTVQEIKAVANLPSTPGATVRVGYRLYQTVPGGGYRILAMYRPSSTPEDNADHGSGPTEYISYLAATELPDSLIGPKSADFIASNPGYFDGPSSVFSITSPTDTTYRVYNEGLPFGFNNRGWNEWVVSATVRPDGSNCSDLRPEPVMRKEITGVGCTFIPDPNRPYYIPDVCYVTQLVFEKVD